MKLLTAARRNPAVPAVAPAPAPAAPPVVTVAPVVVIPGITSPVSKPEEKEKAGS